jgi:Uma2 family endonuclease
MVRDLTPEDYTGWPKYECVDGELLVTPAPRLIHEVALKELLRDHVDPYVERHRLGIAFAARADIELDPHTLVQPDLFVAPLVEGRRPREWSDIASLLLVVEVLSPSTARYNRFTKRRYYQRFGVPEYWIVDVDARAIELWRPGEDRPEMLDQELAWRPKAELPPLVIDLPAYFAGVYDER